MEVDEAKSELKDLRISNPLSLLLSSVQVRLIDPDPTLSALKSLGAVGGGPGSNTEKVVVAFPQRSVRKCKSRPPSLWRTDRE